MSNELLVGKPRTGWLLDGDGTTPEIPAVLEDTGDRIQVTVPTHGLFGKEHYSRWWTTPGASFGDDPNRETYSYQLPRNMMFHDDSGFVALIGCRSGGGRSIVSPTAGYGRIDVDYAVLGGRNFRYDTVNGFRAELPALTAWTNITSIRQQHTLSDSGRITGAALELRSPEPIRLHRTMNLTMRPTWRTSQADDRNRFHVDDVVELATATKRPRSWDEHLAPILAIRDLIALSGWHRISFSSLTVNRGDDPIRVLSGDAVGDHWAPVLTYQINRKEEQSLGAPYLFDYSDLGTTGIRRWLRIRKHFRRAFQPLVAILDQKDSYVETRLLQSSIALDALGYQLALDKGIRKAGQRLSHPHALQQVIDDTKRHPVADPAEWKERSDRCYNGIKHADNPSPHSLEAANTMRENLLVLRFWLAQRLGAKFDNVMGQLRRDPHGRPYKLRDP